MYVLPTISGVFESGRCVSWTAKSTKRCETRLSTWNGCQNTCTPPCFSGHLDSWSLVSPLELNDELSLRICLCSLDSSLFIFLFFRAFLADVLIETGEQKSGYYHKSKKRNIKENKKTKKNNWITRRRPLSRWERNPTRVGRNECYSHYHHIWNSVGTETLNGTDHYHHIWNSVGTETLNSN